MNCTKCGTQNNMDAKFCIGCGSPLDQSQMINQSGAIPNQEYNQQGYSQVNNRGIYNNGKIVGYQNTNNFNPFLFIMKAFLQPMKSFKEKRQEILDTKNALFLGVIVTIFSVILAVVNKVIATVRVTNYFSTDSSWNWENLNSFPWFNVIGKYFLLFVGIIFGIALLFYLASLIIKKDINYFNIVSISSVSVIPSILGIYVLGPIFGMLWDKFAIIFPIIGICYTITILCELINKEIQLDNDQKIYFNFICFSIIFIVLFFVIYQMTIGSALDTISSGYSDIFS